MLDRAFVPIPSCAQFKRNFTSAASKAAALPSHMVCPAFWLDRPLRYRHALMSSIKGSRQPPFLALN